MWRNGMMIPFKTYDEAAEYLTKMSIKGTQSHMQVEAQEANVYFRRLKNELAHAPLASEEI